MALFKRDLLTVNRRSEQLASHGDYVVLPSVFKAVQGPRLNLPASGDVHGDKSYTHATEGQVLFWAHPIIPRTKESVRVRMSLYMVGGPVGESQESRRKVPVHSSLISKTSIVFSHFDRFEGLHRHFEKAVRTFHAFQSLFPPGFCF